MSKNDMVMVSREHELKILPQPFEDLLSGAKTGEVRDCRDRKFSAGDSVRLVEISGIGIEHGPTGRTMCRVVTHIQTGFGLPESLCVLSYGLPVQQHQAEPVALTTPDECPHIIVFDDADRANEYFCGAGARQAALRRYEQISQSWNAHLFVRIARNSRDDRYPSAAVAEPAEVERLRIELDSMNETFGMQEEKIDTLRAQLAEAQALLREVIQAFKLEADGSCINPGRDFIRPWAAKFAALLSRAEPSAPKCGNCAASTGSSCNDNGCGYLEGGNGEPSAPVAIDERSYFEAAYSEHAAEHTSARYNLVEMRRGEEYRVGYHYLNGAWFGWQARAALARKP